MAVEVRQKRWEYQHFALNVFLNDGKKPKVPTADENSTGSAMQSISIKYHSLWTQSGFAFTSEMVPVHEYDERSINANP